MHVLKIAPRPQAALTGLSHLERPGGVHLGAQNEDSSPFPRALGQAFLQLAWEKGEKVISLRGLYAFYVVSEGLMWFLCGLCFLCFHVVLCGFCLAYDVLCGPMWFLCGSI